MVVSRGPTARVGGTLRFNAVQLKFDIDADKRRHWKFTIGAASHWRTSTGSIPRVTGVKIEICALCMHKT